MSTVPICKKRVVVGMSGGVDSSVAAALLKEKGFEVIGATVRMGDGPKEGTGFTGLTGAEDVGRVAHKLKIPHYVLNFEDTFKKKVIDNFCEEYKKGRTPNPCVRCNRYVKFAALIKKAREVDADYIATGHYARIEFDGEGKRYLLKKGVDDKKEQSYFLYLMSQELLKRTLMPLGNFTKSYVKQLAKEKGLPVANRPESQEVCFVPDGDCGRFIMERDPEAAKAGSIVNKRGEVLGRHQGLIFYTIGQRKRIGISAGEPLYVIGIDKEKNAITVGKKEEGYASELRAIDTNYISIKSLKEPLKVKAGIRYLHKPREARIISLGKNSAKVSFKQPQWAIAPGQAVVFYDGDSVVGGGVISEVEGWKNS